MASLWDAIDDELYRLPPELKDPRFDSLRHVLNIVSSVNAESSVEEVSHFCPKRFMRGACLCSVMRSWRTNKSTW